MFKNYFKVSWRNMVRQKLYSSINILGLSIGVFCFGVLLIYIQYERSFDTFYDDADLIYRVYHEQAHNSFNGCNRFSVTPAQVAQALEKDFPEVQAATSVNTPDVEIEDAHKNRFQQKGLFTTASFFEVFDTRFKVGNSKLVFTNPKAIVLTEALAEKIFDNQNPIGEQITIWGITYEVTGIIESLPKNSSLEVTFIANLNARDRYVEELAREEWSNNSYHTFFKIRPGADIESIEVRLQGIAENHWASQEKNPVTYFIQPLSELHLNTGVNWDPGIHGNVSQLRLFAILGFLILLLAGINYTNLALARTLKRSKEVGLRKVIGAVKSQLMFQFLIESFLFLALAFAVALVGLYFLLPVFGNYVDRPMDIGLILSPEIIGILVIVLIIAGLLAGSYPAIIISAMKPIQALKGKLSETSRRNYFQKGLTVVQYAVSSGMVICVVVIYQQFTFVKEKDPGYSRENVLAIRLNDDLQEHVDAAKNDVEKLAQVKAVSVLGNLPVDIDGNTKVKDEFGTDHTLYNFWVNEKFQDVFKLTLASGRFFEKDYATDGSEALLINEQAVRDFGWTNESALGQKIMLGDEQRKVIGVVNDFNMQSLHLPIAPLLMVTTDADRYFTIRFDGVEFSELVSTIEKTLTSYTDYPIKCELLDDKYLQLYEAEIKESKIFGFFSIVAILIAVMGLFGMMALSAEKRIKEIGIRKVLGASVSGIVSLLIRDFLLLICIGCLVAVPFTIYYLSDWLSSYAYHVEISIGVIIGCCSSLILIAMLTVCYQSLKAAYQNPIEALKDE